MSHTSSVLVPTLLAWLMFGMQYDSMTLQSHARLSSVLVVYPRFRSRSDALISTAIPYNRETRLCEDFQFTLKFALICPLLQICPQRRSLGRSLRCISLDSFTSKGMSL